MARMARTFGSHAWLAHLARLVRMARMFGSHGSHVWLAWLACLARMAHTFGSHGSLARILATLSFGSSVKLLTLSDSLRHPNLGQLELNWGKFCQKLPD